MKKNHHSNHLLQSTTLPSVTPQNTILTPLPQPPQSIKRQFLPQNFEISSWQNIELYTQQLLSENLTDYNDFQKWLFNQNELQNYLYEQYVKCRIALSCDTNSAALQTQYAFYAKEIMPPFQEFLHEFNKKLADSPFFKTLKNNPDYHAFTRYTEVTLNTHTPLNIPIQAEININSRHYDTLIGSMSITLNDMQYTMPQATDLMKSQNRETRKQVFEAVVNARTELRQPLDQLFDKLLSLRHQSALNANFKNYRDYTYAYRFDYTPKQCSQFHEAIAEVITPIASFFEKKRQQALNLTELYPWDASVEINNNSVQSLKPFENTTDLLQKSIKCLHDIHPQFADYLQVLQQKKHLDLESRPNKAPGGYNCQLPETGIPFIFMNATKSLRTLETLFHETGHAIHSILEAQLPLSFFRYPPSEVCELASMSMELISMEHWQPHFFTDTEQYKQAKAQHLRESITALPSMAITDSFQHWLYTNPQHTPQERNQEWLRLRTLFDGNVVQWLPQYTEHRSYGWHAILHIFKSPFYYIEYAMAQLGAIAMWRNYKKNKNETLNNYIKALSLGYTRSVPQIYKTAGIEFNFSKPYIKDLTSFVLDEIDNLVGL